MEDQLKHFTENGFVIIERALSPNEVDRVNDGIAADEAANPKEWEPGPRPGFISVGCGAPELMHRTDALDGIPNHPSVVPLVKRILGEDAQFCNLNFLRREPCHADPPEDIDGDNEGILAEEDENADTFYLGALGIPFARERRMLWWRGQHRHGMDISSK